MNRLVRASATIAALVIASIIGLSVSSAAVARDDKLSAEAFRAEMRRLWEDHIVWTRQYIVSAATAPDSLPDIGPTAERLFRNQSDIGAAVGTFYGTDAGAALTELLTEHIAIAADVLDRAKRSDPGFDGSLAAWYANGDDIAAFLAAANPGSWPLEPMRMHMRHHLDLTLDEAAARLSGDFEADIRAYDEIHVQILELADALADGIITAFPARFSR